MLERIDRDNVPRHVAMIMDGNGRWARKRWMPRSAGHRAGVEVLTPILEAAGRAGVRSLTLYAFSTENWTRPDEEVSGLMSLFIEKSRTKVPELHERGARLRFVGRTEALSEKIQKAVREAEEMTAGNEDLDVYVALNYGGRSELVDAARRMISAGISPDEVDEETFSYYLYAPEASDMDLVIRTSGELRVSNFLLWQIAYAEFYVTETLWPDFSSEEFLKAIETYASRSRRRGGV